MFGARWNFSEDIIEIGASAMFPLEIAKKYEIGCFCVNTVHGIYYQKRRGDTFDIILVNKEGSSKVLKNAFVAGSDGRYSCAIIHSIKDKKNYLVDTRGILFSLPELPEIYVLGPMQLDLMFHRDKGIYTIRGDSGKTLWTIKSMSERAVVQYLSDTAADTSQMLNPEFIDFINRNDNCKYLFFTCRANKQGKIVEWLINHGLQYEVVPNVFADDDTFNIRIKHNKQNNSRIDFQYLYTKYSSSFSIYNIPIEHILSAINISYIERHKYNLLLPTLNNTQLKMCDCIINTLKFLLHTDKPIDVYKRILIPVLQQFYIKNGYDANNVFECIMLTSTDPDEIKLSRTKYKFAIQNYEAQLLAEMTKEGISISKWTQEVEMFTLIHKQFPDAIYQYHISWLGKQSLDVYVPSINTAFEYQGIQHYQPVEIFGGIEGYNQTTERDARKSVLCQKHGVKVIYWKYDEPITSKLLKEKLSDVI